MKRLISGLRLSIKSSIYIVLVLTIVTLLGQLLLPFIEHYKPAIEKKLSSSLHTSVRIQQIKARWLGIEPDISLTGLTIYHPTQANTPLLVIDHVHIELALWQSLRAWDWRLDAQVAGIDMHIAEQASGEWVIEEMLALGASRPDARQKTITWLLTQAAWDFSDINVELHPYQQDTMQLENLSLVNHNRGHRHDFRVSGLLNQQPFKLSANLKTDASPLVASSWYGQLYANVPVQSWQAWLPSSLLPAELKLSQLVLGAELWGELRQGQLQALTADIHAPKIELSYQQQLFHGQQLSALVSWQQQEQGWELSTQHWQGFINQQPIPLTTFVAKQHQQRLEVAARDINIAPLSQLLQQTTLVPELKNWLTQAKPQGKVSKLSAIIQLATDNSSPQLESLSAEFTGLSSLASADYVGGRAINGWFVHQPHGGQAHINISNGELDLRPIYRVPTLLHHLDAKMTWSNLGNSWLVKTSNVQLSNDDTHGDAVLSVWWPKDDILAAQMHLLASIYDAKLASVWRYVPWPSAGDDTLAWLKSALVTGTIKRGDFLYEGVLIDKPNRPPSTMQMNFRVKDGVLAYAPDWPQITQLNAQVTINNRHLQIKAENSQIYESIIRHVVADIPDLNQPLLAIDADIDSTGDDVMRLFKDTPLQKEAGRVADLLAIKSEIAGSVHLDIPLASNNNDINVNVTAELPGNAVVLKQASQFDLWLSGIVNYQTGHGLTSQTMNGFFLSQPVSVKLQSVLDSGDVAAIQIQANGQITPISLKPWLADLTRSMSGSMRYQAALTVPITNDPVHLAISSDLAGWIIDLPKPLAKKQEPMPLRYEMQLDDHQEQSAYLRLGQELQTIFAIKEGKITRALVQLGEEKIGDLPEKGLWMTGHLTTLNIDDWLPWLRPAVNNSVSKNMDAALPELQSFNVDIDSLSFAGYLLHNVRLGLEQEDNQAWRLQMESDDLSGEVIFPHRSQQAMTVNIQHLNLPFDKEPSQANQPANHQLEWSIPKMNIHVADLSLKAWPKFAHSELDTQLIPTAKGVLFNQTKLKNSLFSVDGNLDWQWRGSESTRYTGQIMMPNIANVFSVFNATPALNSQESRAQLALQWQGNPTQLALNSLNGEFSLDLKNGRVLNLNRMLSVTRLLGVLDSDNFKRRLKFDFSDITQKGLAYDQIHFDALIEKGIMRNQLSFISPSLMAQGQGTANLMTTDVNQMVDISVPISSAVPYAAALVAGPLVGGALVAAEAMLDTPLTKMTTMHYQISGKWHNPTVERQKTPMLPWRKWLKSRPTTVK